MKMFYHFPAPKTSHSYKNVNYAMKTSINPPNLDIIRLKIDVLSDGMIQIDSNLIIS